MTDVALSLDCLGMKCPRPIIELNARISEVPRDGLVELWADDPAAGPDLAAWCRMTGHELILTEPPRFVVRLRKGAPEGGERR